MKKALLSLLLMLCIGAAQAQLSDTITFEGIPGSTIVTNQYQSNGFIFTGHNGSGDPITHDYGTGSHGNVLHSETWFNELRFNLVDPMNPGQYQLAQRIELDNPIDTETDYMVIDVYDENDNLIHHYVSTSPEYVSITFPSPMAAYVVLDDSAATAYVVDDILVEWNIGTTVDETPKEAPQFSMYPNPSNGLIHVASETIIDEIRVINAVGQVVHIESPKGQRTSLNIDRPGAYFVSVLANNQVSVRPLVITH